MNVLLFGITKDIIGKPILSLEEEKPMDVKQLKEELFRQYPNLKSLSSLSIAVNSSYAEDSQLLNEGDEIALIPPVSGG